MRPSPPQIKVKHGRMMARGLNCLGFYRKIWLIHKGFDAVPKHARPGHS